jgi:hypothetical protein
VPLQTATVIRESVYTGSYLGLCPVLQGYIAGTSWARQGPPGTALVVSGISAGLFASVVTQPIDTAKTRMQAFVNVKVKPLIWLPACISRSNAGNTMVAAFGTCIRALQSKDARDACW